MRQVNNPPCKACGVVWESERLPNETHFYGRGFLCNDCEAVVDEALSGADRDLMQRIRDLRAGIPEEGRDGE